ncbi:MAG TPA: tetratricopeptide repeat protein [Candidatus Baltobacteraceae bacterium]|nr:tetratricopeptide repeat protein [Candidatus Baltobacteraceae bacterium]
MRQEAACFNAGELLNRKRTVLRLQAAGLIAVFAVFTPRAAAQDPAPDWQAEVRTEVSAHKWDVALHTIDLQIAQSPDDMDIRAWHARVLAWAGRASEAEREFDAIIRAVPNDPDNWMTLGNVYMQEGRTQEALRATTRAVEIDPSRADLHEARGRVLLALGDLPEARSEFQRAADLDPQDADARAELASLRGETKHELRIGNDDDLFNFTSGNEGEWVSLVSKWSPHWTTSAAGNFYQIAGTPAGKFIGSVTASATHWGALTVGGATGHDNTVIPESEAFFEGDHGWRISEEGFVRGVEVTYGQHWYWYSAARILTLNENTLVYLPKDWLWSLATTGARSRFLGTGVDWKPSGLSKLAFPMHSWGERRLSGNVFFAVGTEDFALVDEIGSFSSQTYGGGLRFQITARQDITGYAAFQQRTQDRTDTSFGWSYGIRF